MSSIVEILCRRDGISMNEAVRRVKRVQRALAEVNYSYDEVEQIMMDELGLEMDYIDELL